MQDVEAQPVSETLSCLLKFAYVALRPQKRLSNAYLVYALMHEHEAICETLVHPAVQRATCGSEVSANGLYELTRHFYASLLVVSNNDGNEEGHYLSATQAMSALLQVIRDEPTKEDPEAADHQTATFAYEEGENADEFFVPLAWKSILNNA